MTTNYDQVALTWVKSEISATLDKARQSLETYFEDTDDQSQMRYCISCLHQVQGTLLMLEIVGGAMLAEEMENLANEMSSDINESSEESFEVLMRAILQLPTYLERLQSGKNDDPVVLIPILNELRQQRGLPEMLESQFFHVNLEIPHEAKIQEIELPEDFNLSEEVTRLRQKFQKALLGVMKNTNVEESFELIHAVFDKLELMTAAENMGPLWWVASGFVYSIENDDCHLFIETEGNFVNYVEIDILRTTPCSLKQPFDSEPILGCLSINPAELELYKKQTHYHHYRDHKRKLKISVSCSHDGGPLSVGFSAKYYNM